MNIVRSCAPRSRVDHHLHGDAAVDEQRRPHAGRDRQHVLRLLVDLHVLRARCGRTSGCAGRARPPAPGRVGKGRHRVRVAAGTRDRGCGAHIVAHRAGASDTLRSACGAPIRCHAVVAGAEQVRAVAGVEDELALQARRGCPRSCGRAHGICPPLASSPIANAVWTAPGVLSSTTDQRRNPSAVEPGGAVRSISSPGRTRWRESRSPIPRRVGRRR